MNDDIDQKEFAWHSFFLGVRTAVEAYNIALNDTNRHEYIRRIREIADGNFTLADPEKFASTTNPEQRQTLTSIAQNAIQYDRELAKLILDGLDRITNTDAKS